MLAFKSPLVGGEKDVPVDWPRREFVCRIFPMAAEATAKRFADLNDDKATFEDLTRCLAGTEEDLYWDCAHTNNRGNEIIAGHVFSRIRARVETAIAGFPTSDDPKSPRLADSHADTHSME